MTDHVSHVPDRKLRTRFLSWMPFFVATLLFTLGLFALSHLLHEVHLHEIVAQIKSTPAEKINLALGCTFLGYFCLASYDWSALRHIDKKLPAPVALTGGFIAYALGNTLGLTAISGSAVRWRLYSGLGLDGYDIAAISAFTAVAFGMTTTIIGLTTIAVHPDLLTPVISINPSSIRIVACALLTLIVAPLLWLSVSGQSIHGAKFSVRGPSPKVLCVQGIISLGDIVFAALTLYVLLPASDISFLAFLAIFSAAVIGGVVSNVPGGVGVFETIILASLPAPDIPGQVAAALLLYRAIYYLVPFALGIVILAISEALHLARQQGFIGHVSRLVQATEPALRAFSPITPALVAFTTFGAGVWMATSALLPPMSRSSEALFPLAFLEGSALITSALGTVLIILSQEVIRRSLPAFWLVVALMAMGATISLIQNEHERSLTLILFIAVFLPFRRTFSRRTLLTNAPLTPTWIMLILGTIVGLGFTLFFSYKSIPYGNELWWQFAHDAHAPRALRAALVAALTLCLSGVFFLFRPTVARVALPDTVTLEIAGEIASRVEDPDAGFALTGDKSILLSDDSRAFIMFSCSGHSWIAFGGPFGPTDAAQEVAFDFVDAARREGAEPVFYEVGMSDVPIMLDLGMTLHKMGEEAIVDLVSFSLEGPHRKSLRSAWSRAKRHELAFEVRSPPHDYLFLETLREISDEWLAAAKSHEKGFSVGRFSEMWLNRWQLALVLHQKRIVAFANIMTTDVKKKATIDMMRYSSTAPPGTMDFLFTALMLHLKQEGYEEFTMGMAPLSGLTPERSRKVWDHFGTLLYRHGGRFYNFSGLRAFKQKFCPEWHPRYLATASAHLPLIEMTDAARLISREQSDKLSA